MLGTHINSFGLLLDIAGALLLIKFGIPPKLDREGRVNLVLSQTDEKQVRKAKLYDRWSTLAIVLIILGFALQLFSNYVGQ